MKVAIILHWNCLLQFLPPQLECGLLQGRNQILFISGSPAPNSGIFPEQVLHKCSLSRWINDCVRKRYQDIRLIQMRARPDAIKGNWGSLPKEEYVWDGDKMAVCSTNKGGGGDRIPSGGDRRHKGRKGGQRRNSEGWGRRVSEDV